MIDAVTPANTAESAESPPPSPSPAVDSAPSDAPSPPEPAKPVWNSLEAVKLLVAVAVPVSIFVAGNKVADVTKAEASAKADREAVQRLSQAILQRRAQSELLYSSVIRNFTFGQTDDSKTEMIERKKNYDAVWASWNADIRGNLLVLREIGGGPNVLDSYFQNSLSLAIFKPMDACLTDAYDLAIRGKEEGKQKLYDCDIKSLLGQALNCGYMLTTQAQLISQDRSKAQQALDRVKRVCPEPAVGAAAEPND